MMGQIREETIGFLFNLEVEVAQQGAAPRIEAKGLQRPAAPEDKLSYSAPSDSGGVEVRNQRGQIQQAATQRARRAVAQQQQPQQPAQPAARGAFGQRAEGDGGSNAPMNRQERRAQDRKGR
jgi:preprotein translocase subunit SecA